MELIDSHIHLDFNAFDKDRETLLAQARSAGINQFVVPATTRGSWDTIRKLQANTLGVSVAYGVHPYFAHDHCLADCEALDQWLEQNRCVAIGEIGLDYFLRELDRQHQLTLFEAQLAIARNYGLPVILHARKAVDDVIIQLKTHGLTRGIVHSFNGSEVQAGKLIDQGFKLGFGGVITYPGASRLRSLIKTLPLDAICLETDAPDQPSLGFKGARNQPSALIEVLETVAELRNTSVEVIAQHATENTYAALKF